MHEHVTQQQTFFSSGLSAAIPLFKSSKSAALRRKSSVVAEYYATFPSLTASRHTKLALLIGVNNYFLCCIRGLQKIKTVEALQNAARLVKHDCPTRPERHRRHLFTSQLTRKQYYAYVSAHRVQQMVPSPLSIGVSNWAASLEAFSLYPKVSTNKIPAVVPG